MHWDSLWFRVTTYLDVEEIEDSAPAVVSQAQTDVEMHKLKLSSQCISFYSSLT